MPVTQEEKGCMGQCQITRDTSRGVSRASQNGLVNQSPDVISLPYKEYKAAIIAPLRRHFTPLIALRT